LTLNKVLKLPSVLNSQLNRGDTFDAALTSQINFSHERKLLLKVSKDMEGFYHFHSMKDPIQEQAEVLTFFLQHKAHTGKETKALHHSAQPLRLSASTFMFFQT